MRQDISFEKLNWMDIEEYLRTDNRLVIPTGSCEQHGYLSLATDTLTPFRIAYEACKLLHILLAPALPYGVTPYFRAFPGTISLKQSTYIQLITEIIEEFYHQGFHRILICNGHGGNSALLENIALELNTQYSDIRIGVLDWWELPQVLDFGKQVKKTMDHANWSEAFDFNQVCSLPEGEKAPITTPLVLSAQENKRNIGDGVFSGFYYASKEIMDQLFTIAVDAVVTELQKL